MYTRSYFTEDKKVDVPENYDGNAFEKENDIPAQNESECFLGSSIDSTQKSVDLGAFSRLLERLPIRKLLKGIPLPFLKCDDDKAPARLGSEEILILAVMLYMFFSKDGDKECALMLLFLLFI